MENEVDNDELYSEDSQMTGGDSNDDENSFEKTTENKEDDDRLD